MKILQPSSAWLDDSHRHEVMKAVLLNSADKMAEVHGSQRTVISRAASSGYNWTQTTAYSEPDTSLDVELGAGHLNARRAVTQLRGGPFDAGSVVENIGWDFHETGGTGTVLRYPLADSLAEDDYVSVTLAWDRRVLEFGPLENHYSAGDFFVDGGMNDLDVFLLPSGWQNFNEYVAKSDTLEDNLEHIFAPVPAAGDYEIVVYHSGGIGDDQKLGLAWWAGEIEAIPGDFDDDNDVDGDDLSEWKMDFGEGDGADADGDGDSDGNDFLVWQRYVGTGVNAVAAQAPVPEPAAWLLAAVGLPFLLKRRAAA